MTDCFSARESAATLLDSLPIPGSRATFFQTLFFHRRLSLCAPRKVFSSWTMSRTSGRTMTKRCSRGKKTSAAPGRVLLNVTANVSGGCGDFICSVVPAHSEHAACTPSRCSFRKTSLETMSATRERRSPHCTLTLGIAPSRRRARPAQVSILNSTLSSLRPTHSPLRRVRVSASATSQSPRPTRRSHLPPYRVRNGQHRGRGLRLLARPYGSVPVRRGQTRGHTYPRSQVAAAAFRASTPAIWGRRPHLFDNRRTNRFESAPDRPDSEKQIHPSTSPRRNVRRLDRSRHDAFASFVTTGDLSEAHFRWSHDLSKTHVAFSNSPPGPRCAPPRPAR